MYPLVSVVIPTHNRASLLKKAVQSVLEQTYTNLEIIIVDDASHDGTRQTVEALRDKRIHYIRHDRNYGVSAARNRGITASRGEFIAFLDDDDSWLPEKLALQLERMVNPRIGLVYCGALQVTESGLVRDSSLVEKRGDIFAILLFKNIIITPTVIVRRECFEKVGLFDITLRTAEDHDMWIRIAHHYEVDCVPKFLVRYTSHRHPHLNRPSLLIPAFRKLNEKFESYTHGSALLRRRARAYRLYTLANMYAITGQMAEARRTCLQSLAQWPANLKCWVTLCASLLGVKASLRLAVYKQRLLRRAGRMRADSR